MKAIGHLNILVALSRLKDSPKTSEWETGWAPRTIQTFCSKDVLARSFVTKLEFLNNDHFFFQPLDRYQDTVTEKGHGQFFDLSHSFPHFYIL